MSEKDLEFGLKGFCIFTLLRGEKNFFIIAQEIVSFVGLGNSVSMHYMITLLIHFIFLNKHMI